MNIMPKPGAGPLELIITYIVWFIKGGKTSVSDEIPTSKSHSGKITLII